MTQRHPVFAPCHRFACLAAPLLALCVGAAQAQGQASDEDLARRAADPTRSPLSLQFYDYWSPSVYGTPGSLNQLIFRPVIPYKAFGVDNIIRFTLGWSTDSPTGRTGANDLQVLQLSIVEALGGRVAFGFSGSAPMGVEGFTSDRWTIGLSFGYVTGTSGGVTYGALMQTFFSVGGSSGKADVAQLNLQPVLAVPLGAGRTLSLGSTALLYDAERGRWASISPSLQYSWMTRAGGITLRPQIEYTHELRDLTGNPKNIFRIGVQVLL
jgi:hypothetical protein